MAKEISYSYGSNKAAAKTGAAKGSYLNVTAATMERNERAEFCERTLISSYFDLVGYTAIQSICYWDVK
jgi:ribulose 1,5-bisphosphate carboxylase large subunit-like protein